MSSGAGTLVTTPPHPKEVQANIPHLLEGCLNLTRWFGTETRPRTGCVSVPSGKEFKGGLAPPGSILTSQLVAKRLGVVASPLPAVKLSCRPDFAQGLATPSTVSCTNADWL